MEQTRFNTLDCIITSGIMRSKLYLKLLTVLLINAVCFLIIAFNDNTYPIKHTRNLLEEKQTNYEQSLAVITEEVRISSNQNDPYFPPQPLQKSANHSMYPLTLQGRYKISNPNICKNNSMRKMDTLIIVHTATVHFSRRSRMRRSFGNSSVYLPFQVRMVFLLGTTFNKRVQSLIEEENSIFKDIVQGNFIDSYRNLTHKGVLGLRWISEFCRNVSIVVKIDDDVFINLFELIEKHMTNYTKHKCQIFCNHIRKNTMPILRDKISKWYVRENEFRGLKSYPLPYCSGFAVFLSGDLIPLMYRAAFSTPFFWVDDFYLFGMLPSRIANVTYHDLGKLITLYTNGIVECLKPRLYNCTYLAMPLVKPDLLWKVVLSNRNLTVFPSYNTVKPT